MSMPDQPPNDYANDVHQVVLDLAEQFRDKVPEVYRDKALNMFIFEVQGEDPPVVSESVPVQWPVIGSPEWERLPF